ncbi:hypothetical protein AB4P97_15780 [Pseudomonas sp. A1230]|uniref:hypothetical protein n=1 Tax=Pseudomonas sp. A1230 TaxID=3235106 RepID=UPI003783233D
MKNAPTGSGRFFSFEENNRDTADPCGSWLASDSGVSGNEDVCCADVIAGKPAPTGFYACPENETSVMKLTALRPNVADSAACSTVAKNATTPCSNKPFT